MKASSINPRAPWSVQLKQHRAATQTRQAPQITLAALVGTRPLSDLESVLLDSKLQRIAGGAA